MRENSLSRFNSHGGFECVQLFSYRFDGNYFSSRIHCFFCPVAMKNVSKVIEGLPHYASGPIIKGFNRGSKELGERSFFMKSRETSK